jgi:hypothetical protein
VSQSGASGTTSADIIVTNYTDNRTTATLNWTQIGGGTGSDQGQGISLSSSSTIYVVGTIVPTATFGSLSVTNPAGSPVNFLGQLSAAIPRAATPLPVGLTAFTATPTADGLAVRVEWATASEAHSARFEVERSADGVSFAAFRTVTAAGSSLTTHPYALTDAALPMGARQLYYRLRQVDVDGTASYSSVQVVAVRQVSSLILFPNPARATTALAGAAPGAVVQVLDVRGHLVATADATETARLLSAFLEKMPVQTGVWQLNAVQYDTFC